MISNAILSAITLQTYAAVDSAANVMAGPLPLQLRLPPLNSRCGICV